MTANEITKWEYRAESIIGANAVILNGRGKDGWELVAVIQSKYENIVPEYIFKRPALSEVAT